MPYENRSEEVMPADLWLRRVARSAGMAAVVVFVSLTIGVLGYHYLGDLEWVDALLEASMILGGMGPVATMSGDAVKIFASVYALFSGLVLLAVMGVLLAPWVHRMLHKFHAETNAPKTAKKKQK